VTEGSECSTGGAAWTATELLLSHTYHGDKGKVARAQLADPATTEEVRTEIERQFNNRVRHEGRAWKVGYGKDACKIEPSHAIVKEFIERTGITQHLRHISSRR
jgi:hypothetical protein